ncbi:MAG: LamG domain-containing protein, partial [bacterium]|nr:LamG domain-containing protein [bacterium]
GTLITNDGSTNKAAVGVVGGALSFDGADDYVVTTQNVGITGASARTLEFWCKVNAVASSQSILGWGAAGTYYSFVPSIYLGHWFFWGQAYDWDTGVTPQTGIWQHHAVTFDGTRVRWWIDGSQLGTGADLPLLNTTNSAFYMGRFTPGWFGYANVGLDEVRIYNRA